jgi:hypothetical protein
MLAEMLKLIDDLEVYDQSKGVQPVLVLDGHQSRMKLPFLQYINDPAHPWTVCLGVPYGTHIWQVADSLELKGSFKIAFTRAKAEYLAHCGLFQQKFKKPILYHWYGWHGTIVLDASKRPVELSWIADDGYP